MILGGPGSGKSTLARQIGVRTGLPVHHMDRIHWLPGWVMRDRTERIAMANAVEAQDAWVFEGGLSATYDNRAARADLIVWLDLPIVLRLWRVVMRWRDYRGSSRPDLPAGCPEQLDPEFLLWIVTSRRRTRRRIRMLLAGPGKGKAVHLTRPRQVRVFLETVPQCA
ncbi:MAG: AAA family ATPase [Pseudomonadota bacterium]